MFTNLKLRDIKKNRRYILLFIIVAFFYLFILFLVKTYKIEQEDIREFIEPFGVYGVLGLFFLQMLFSLTPLPDGAMPIIAAITYGWQGLLIILLAHYCSSVLHFLLARRLGKSVIERKFPLIKKYSDKVIGENTIMKLIYIRIFSIVSFDIAAYVAGISGVDFKRFSIAAILGLLPTNAILMIMSSGLFAESYLDYLNVGFWLIISLSVLAFWYKKSRIRNT